MFVMLLRTEDVPDVSWLEALKPLAEKGYEVRRYYSRSTHPRTKRWYYLEVPEDAGEESKVGGSLRSMYESGLVDAFYPWMAMMSDPHPT